jgi:recombination protein RecT
MADKNESTAIVKNLNQQYTNLSSYLLDKRAVLGNLLVKTSGLDAERMIRMLLSTTSRNPDLLKCNPQSILLSLLDCAYYSLEPNPALGHAYIVPFGDKAQMIVGYRGMVLLAHRTGFINDIEAVIVHEADKFRIKRHLTVPYVHEPAFVADPGPMIGVYATATMKNGFRKFLPLTKAEVDRYKSRSRGSNIWASDYDAMARKTAIRRICSQLPLDASHHLAQAIAQERTFDMEGVNNVAPGAADIEGSTVTQLPARKRGDELADRLEGQRPAQAVRGKSAAGQAPVDVIAHEREAAPAPSDSDDPRDRPNF